MATYEKERAMWMKRTSSDAHEAHTRVGLNYSLTRPFGRNPEELEVFSKHLILSDRTEEISMKIADSEEIITIPKETLLEQAKSNRGDMENFTNLIAQCVRTSGETKIFEAIPIYLN